ncbi:MAG: hypothetical protein GY822_17460 [Deltaproteobacteria bacterium]|nr:hypothetical protein [Deltaproteobacteria bacterium]
MNSLPFMPYLSRPISQGNFRFSFVVAAIFQMCLFAILFSGCVGPTTSMKLPSCTENIEVKGQHLRRGDTTLTFDHALDLPGSATRATIEREDGTLTERSFINAYPDVLHVVGGGLSFLAGGALIAIYLEELGRGADPLRADVAWAAPVGGGLLLVSGGLLMTGWNPAGPIVLPAECGVDQ